MYFEIVWLHIPPCGVLDDFEHTGDAVKLLPQSGTPQEALKPPVLPVDTYFCTTSYTARRKSWT